MTIVKQNSYSPPTTIDAPTQSSAKQGDIEVPSLRPNDTAIPSTPASGNDNPQVTPTSATHDAKEGGEGGGWGRTAMITGAGVAAVGAISTMLGSSSTPSAPLNAVPVAGGATAGIPIGSVQQGAMGGVCDPNAISPIMPNQLMSAEQPLSQNMSMPMAQSPLQSYGQVSSGTVFDGEAAKMVGSLYQSNRFETPTTSTLIPQNYNNFGNMSYGNIQGNNGIFGTTPSLSTPSFLAGLPMGTVL